MNFLKKLFVKDPEVCASKGDSLMASGSYYEARIAFEDGLGCCGNSSGHEELKRQLLVKISEANRSLALLNIEEAQHSLSRGSIDKAVEHLELAKTLTDDCGIREKADNLLAGMVEKPNDQAVLAPTSSCSSCSSCSDDHHAGSTETDATLDALEHYQLLIHQLPEEIYERYSKLGEDFAYMYVTASHDHHEEALKQLESWFNGSDPDIYYYEKGKILHRLGRVAESEVCMKDSILEVPENPLPHLGLALLYMEENRLVDAAHQVETMINADIFTGQALMMRGEIFELSGDTDGAIRQYGSLLESPIARSAAERLHGILIASDRHTEAAHVFKRYLGKCQH